MKDEIKEIYNHQMMLPKEELPLQTMELLQDRIILERVSDNLKGSIKSITEKLLNNKEPFKIENGTLIYLNDYQVCRLKAIRMKCKELLRIIEGDNNE